MSLKVSVVMPAYNGAKFIAKSIDSALGQNYQPHEIIVIDDGSKDETPRILARYADKIQVHRIPNGGVANAMNTGFKKASGDVIAILEQDDLWFHQKLARQVAFMEKYPEVGICVCNMITRKNAKSRLLRHYSRLFHKKQINFDAPLKGDSFLAVYRENFVCTFSSMMLRRDLFDSVGYLNSRYRICLDLDFLLRCAQYTRFGLIEDVLLFKKAHENNLSGDKVRMYEEHREALLDHFNDPYVGEKKLQKACRYELAQNNYHLGSIYFEGGDTVKAFATYWQGLKFSLTVKNFINFSAVVSRKLVRILSFGKISRKALRSGRI
ncbi:MAG: glycosyltransferase [Candidatus Omnitrophica bacterium]|nr:glycosyltransferase [Candidatus Omnitrophota bacterium]